MPRLHGFHRFLPHLWELFCCAASKPNEPGRPQHRLAAFSRNLVLALLARYRGGELADVTLIGADAARLA